MAFQARLEATLPPKPFYERVKEEFKCSVNRYAVAMILSLSIVVVGAFYWDVPTILCPMLAMALILSTAFTSCFLKRTTKSGGNCGI